MDSMNMDGLRIFSEDSIYERGFHQFGLFLPLLLPLLVLTR